MSAVTKHIETILKENEKLSSLLKEVIDKTAVECLVNGEELYFHDEPPHTKSGLSGGLYDEKEKIKETPYLCIIEVGGASVESVLDNNRTIQIYVRMPEDNIERIIREIQKTLDNTYGREMEYQDLIYNYYSFNEIGQPLFLEKTDNVVLYSVRYRAGYTVYEKSAGGSGEEPGGEVEDTKWPRILKSKFLAKKTPVERQGASWIAESIDPDGIKLKVSVSFKDNFKTINYEEKIFKEYTYEYKYRGKNIKGGILVLDNSNKPSEIYSLDMISDYCDSGKLRVLKIYSIIGNFMPVSVQKEKFIYRIDSKYNEKTQKYDRSFLYDERLVSKEVKDFRWDGDTRSGITVIKACILKSEAYKDLLFLLKRLADKQYYVLDSESLMGWIKESDIKIISPDKKVPHWSSINSVNTNFKSMTFGSKDGFIVKEVEDRFFIYFIFKDLLYSSDITFCERNKGSEVYIYSRDTRDIAYKAKIKTDENGFEMLNELKQEGLELSFDIDTDDRNQKQ